MAIKFFIPLREEALAVDHAAGIEFGCTSGNLVAQAVQLGFAHPVLVLQQPHAFTHRLTGGLMMHSIHDSGAGFQMVFPVLHGKRKPRATDMRAIQNVAGRPPIKADSQAAAAARRSADAPISSEKKISLKLE